ncbi:amidohydrolase family protein [Sulfitobacter geojensis]|uniref:Amidohydrolase family protein n=1 Tax=Sulfitobacter geojensis TaxID=1342299 RepID=A0AAE3B5R2_9RHOB|nr:amidohydrolase family protein [Sulfitobacter geojensis]MBM1688250.1 amidohydrolase family protein [Sulfitobacter geojensis]MBM1692317.1 amidohydrolase family protein [Sulfitobacter geojensis]MBM1704483.1 amidohydrolase family protein [Sulfitobacter geojensis]MBM1708541.1 amidohydrolase family protein [Sulfitobacter geojensis]MBM1712606.1 amidohydrolase family protein [Sulfitobacter geojensis]
MQVDTLLTGGTVLTMDPQRRVIDAGAVAVAAGKIVAIGTALEIGAQVQAAEVIDCADKIIIPGLIDVHAHAGHGLIKSIGMHGGDRWEDICGEVYTQASPPEFWYAEARLAALERLRFGVTTGVSLLGGGDTIMRTDDPAYAAAHCRGVVEVGTRSMVAVGPTRAPHPRPYADWETGEQRHYEVSFEQQMQTSREIVQAWHNTHEGRIQIAMLYPVLRDEHEEEMPPADYATACEQAQLVRAYARERGLVFTQDGHWRGSIRRAEKLGLLGAETLLSHCIDLHADEIDLVAASDTKIAHNPSANASIMGRCPAIELMAAGATVALGSDATAPDRSGDMLRHMQQAMHYHRTHFRDASVLPIGKSLEMCTIAAARALGMDSRIGSVEVGKQADLTVVDLRRAHLYPPNMPVHRLVCFANGNDVDTVLVGGEVVLRDGQATRVDEAAILEDARVQAAQMIARIGGQGDLALPSDFWG